jgi:RNA polymerase sigma factor (sigma-70 family)
VDSRQLRERLQNGIVPTPNARLAELMTAAQTGDKVAYEQLLETVTPLLRRLVRRQRGFPGADEVEDIVQDILLSVHAVRRTYDPTRPFLPWLLAITRNRLADEARRHARTSAHEVAVDDLDVTFEAGATNPHNEGYGDPDALRQAIERLPSGQRQAIKLLKLGEMCLKDAAAASGTSVGALKVATHRAMVTLRRLLATK